MAKCWRLMGQYNAVTTTFSGLAGTPASPYTPDFDGRLVGLRVITSRNAATSLIDFVQFRLTCNTFKPNVLEIGVDGGGLQTAPVLKGLPTDYEVDQEIRAGVPITIEGRNITSGTPVTTSVFLIGMFISNN